MLHRHPVERSNIDRTGASEISTLIDEMTAVGQELRERSNKARVVVAGSVHWRRRSADRRHAGKTAAARKHNDAVAVPAAAESRRRRRADDRLGAAACGDPN